MKGTDPAIDIVSAHASRGLDPALVQSCVEAVLTGESTSYGYISIVLSDAATVHRLNREFLQHDHETDVLSFALHEEGDPIEGEVYVDLDMAARVAPEYDTSFENEALRYVIHGVLHLCGHDDSNTAQRAAMRILEDRYLISGKSH